MYSLLWRPAVDDIVKIKKKNKRNFIFYRHGDSKTPPVVSYKRRYLLAMAGMSVVCTREERRTYTMDIASVGDFL